MKNKQQTFLIIFSAICICLTVGFVMTQFQYIKNHGQDVRWGVLNSDAMFTNRKKVESNIGVKSTYVLSHKNKDLTTGFYTSDGTWLRSIDGGGGLWGRGTTPMGGNPFKQPLPDHLILTYYSALEDQFYQLDTSLPKAKINDLFHIKHKGWGDHDEVPSTNIYDDFDIAIAPQGWVVLFTTGPYGNRKEIGYYQANKIEADYDVDILMKNGGDLDWLKKQNFRKQIREDNLERFKKIAPTLYKNYKEGKGLPTSNWYKQMQTKFPWNLDVTAPDGEWNGEYYAEYANTERYEVLDDQLALDRTKQKAVPVKIITWITYKPTGVKYYLEFHMFPIPKWAAARYIPYYQDPNLTLFFKKFQDLFPLHNLFRNELQMHESEFAKLKIDLDENFKIKDIYLKLGKKIVPIEGAYEYYLAPIDLNRGGYFPEDDHPHYLTKPKIPDLTDPGVADRD